MYGQKRGMKLRENGFGTLKMKRMIKENILMSIQMYNLFQDTTDLTFGL